MRFAIRDDDTNFFTQPEMLYSCYADLWDIVPPSLCVITQVKGNWPKWLEHIYRHKQHTNWKEWEEDNGIYPVHENIALVAFLKDALHTGKLDICFHAKHHRNADEQLPEEVESNYVRCAEYLTTINYTEDIKAEIKYLNDLFDYKVSVFAPPQDLLSIDGYTSVLRAGLNVCGGGISFLKKQKDARGIVNLVKQFSFKTLFPNDPYPYVLDFKTHREIPYYFPLLPDTPLDLLINQFEMVRRHDGDFVLSTHHAEFNYPMEYNENITLKQVLREFITHVLKYPVQFVTLSQLLSNKQKGQSFKSLHHLKRNQQSNHSL